MNTKTVNTFLEKVIGIAQKDGDTCFIAYGSKEDDQFESAGTNVDFADALLIIQGLVNSLGIDPTVLCQMLEAPKRLASVPDILTSAQKAYNQSIRREQN